MVNFQRHNLAAEFGEYPEGGTSLILGVQRTSLGDLPLGVFSINFVISGVAG